MTPYLAPLPEDTGQQRYPLRESFNGLRYLVKIGAPWRWMPNDLPPWELVCQQPSAGWLQAASRPWCMTCACCCDWSGAAWLSRPEW